MFSSRQLVLLSAQAICIGIFLALAVFICKVKRPDVQGPAMPVHASICGSHGVFESGVLCYVGKLWHVTATGQPSVVWYYVPALATVLRCAIRMRWDDSHTSHQLHLRTEKMQTNSLDLHVGEPSLASTEPMPSPCHWCSPSHFPSQRGLRYKLGCLHCS